VTTMTDLTIRPFEVHVPDEDLVDLQRRIAAARWPSRELVTDRSQGVQLATLQALTRYWATEHDWRRCEAKLNALPQFTTKIDGSASTSSTSSRRTSRRCRCSSPTAGPAR
jgi:Epoxide hydrolase N terminus